MAQRVEDQLIGVTLRRAASIIGVPETRLRRWDAHGLISPAAKHRIGAHEIWRYGLEDLVQGRMARELEGHGVHIRLIKKMVEAVRSAEHPRPLASLRWAVDNREAFVLFPNGVWYGQKKPRQGVMRNTLNLDMIRTEARKAATTRVEEAAGRVEKRRGALGSKMVFEGTRIPVSTVVSFLQHGRDESDVLTAYPMLRSADIAYAKELATAG